jgi:hypothetical protein
VFFDLVKIRRLVDDATNLAVRAASGVASSALSNTNNSMFLAQSLGFGGAGGGQAKLSRERKHRMREQATQKLSKAYHLDEIACSVSTMQSASAIEDVAALVMQRSPEDADAKYVHFFHEKIPSRQLAQSTSLTPLNEIITSRPTEGEPLRTRATLRVFKEDYEGAIADLTSALQVHRFHRPPHIAPKSQMQELQQRNGRRQEDIILREEDQPSSLESQLLFQRAGVYLTMACLYINMGLPEQQLLEADAPNYNGRDAGEAKSEPKEADTRRLEEQKLARKLVKSNAKRALRDYMAYLSHFEYSPDLPIEIVEDFNWKVSHASKGIRLPRTQSHPPRSETSNSAGQDGHGPTHRVIPLSDLFAAIPPSGLPPYPSNELVSVRQASQASSDNTTEMMTYHPLLTDALHSLLLCHCLVQTSAKELLRHAHMVGRLARLADGYPIFQASRSPSRADWVEVLRRGDNWIQLSGTWEALCAPAPLPVFMTNDGPASPPSGKSHGQPTKPLALPSTSTSAEASNTEDGQRQERTHHQAVLDALADDSVAEKVRSQAAMEAREARAEEEYLRSEALAASVAALAPTTPGKLGASQEDKASGADDGKADDGEKALTLQQVDKTASPAAGPTSHSAPKLGVIDPRRWAIDDGKEYPILTERAIAIARWVLEAAALDAGGAGGSGAARKKKKKKKPGAAAATSGVDDDAKVADGDADLEADDNED